MPSQLAIEIQLNLLDIYITTVRILIYCYASKF